MPAVPALFNIAGGVRYHLRGWRDADRRWKPFRDALAGWLEGWRQGGEKLLIVGPSGGYCLRMEWLAGFDEVVCLDPDPLARAVFARRLKAAAPSTRLSWDASDFLEEKEPEWQLGELSRFLGHHPDAPVLFSNFLGQLGLLMDEHGVPSDRAIPVWKQKLARQVLGTRPWATFHDRFSGPLAPSFAQPLVASQRLTDQQVVSRLYPDPARTTELADHDTEGFFDPGREHAYFSWELTSRWIHLIEATRSP